MKRERDITRSVGCPSLAARYVLSDCGNNCGNTVNLLAIPA